MNTVYILHSSTLNRYYIGFTTDFELRLDFHLNSDDVLKFTYKAKDWILFLKIECQSKSQGL